MQGARSGEEIMKVVITGAHGFLGWHTSCRLRGSRRIEPIRLSRADFSGGTLASTVAEADVVMHLAGINRADSAEALEHGNLELAQAVAAVLRGSGRPVHVVYANSIQARIDNPYGRGKALAAEVLREAATEIGGTMTDMVMPNLFGEHGRPGYNSFVATFCHEVAQGRTPTVSGDRAIELLHAQRAAEALIQAAEARTDGVVEPRGTYRGISEVLGLLQGFKELYDRGEIPDLSDPFSLDLFNSFRSHGFPQQFPLSPRVHADPRGELLETVRSHGGTGQVFVSTTAPGAKRGDHYHLSKIERFFVIKGDAEIAVRRLYHREIIRFPVCGDKPAFVDMPTMWAHSIRNIGDSELITLFWADQLLERAHPDQYSESVEEIKQVHG